MTRIDTQTLALVARQRPLAIACAVAIGTLCWSGTLLADDHVEFVPTANVQYDIARFGGDDAAFADDDAFRRARLGFNVKKGKSWIFKVEHDVADKTAPELSFQWFGPRGHSLRLGQFKQPYLLEDATADKQTALMEPSLPGAFAISRRIGAEYSRSTDAWTMAVSVFGKRLDGTSHGLGVASRATRAFKLADGGIAHVGISAVSESPDSDSAKFSSRPEVFLTDRTLVKTGTITGINRVNRMAAEAAWLHGPWSLQGEWARVTADGDIKRFQGHGGYAMATWSPSGDGRSYKNGVIGAPKADKKSAWELAARYSRLDLDDGKLLGGRESDWAFGATWYANPHVRVMANYIIADSTRRGIDEKPRILEMRLQLTY